MNVFEIGAMIDGVMAAAKKVQEEVSPGFLLKAGASAAAKFVLEAAKAEGPPSTFAEKLKLEPADATALYNAVLDAAITRK